MHFCALLQAATCLPLLLASAPASPSIAPEAPLLAALIPDDSKPRRVELETGDHQTLVATFFGQRDPTQAAPGVLLVHGAGGSRADLERLALRFQKSGFAALTIDLRGHGESATEALNWKNLDAEAQKSTWTAMTNDIQAGVSHLLKEEGVQPNAISLVGYGAGCTLVARHARRDELVRDIVLLSPQPEQFGFSLTADLAELGGLPSLIVVGKDETTAGKRILEAAGKTAGAECKIELSVAKSDAAALMADNKVQGDLTRWIGLKARPEALAKLPDVRPMR
jgi:dienelactone hydrolase